MARRKVVIARLTRGLVDAGKHVRLISRVWLSQNRIDFTAIATAFWQPYANRHFERHADPFSSGMSLYVVIENDLAYVA